MMNAPKQASSAARAAVTRAARRCALVFVMLLAAEATACRGEGRKDDAAPLASASAAPSSTASSTASPPLASSDAYSKADEEIRPVYPVTNALPDPLADKLCAALHDIPAARKAECCSAVPDTSTLRGECSRTLSFALREKTVTLEPASVDRCAEAMAKAHEACDWVGPLNQPLPADCRGILKGTLAEGERCRSSFDCTTNLHCEGVSPTTFGKCAPPRPASYPCAVGVDTLASYTRQSSLDADRPECSGACVMHVCTDLLPVGAECKSHVMCGPKSHCKAGRCVDAPLPVAGKPCSGGECGGNALCVSGQCVGPKREGEACRNDWECRGACNRLNGVTEGTCGKRCTAGLR